MKSLKAIFTAAVALLFIGTATAQTQPTIDDAIAKYEAAVEALNAKDYEATIPLLEDALTMSIDLEDEGAELMRAIRPLIPNTYYRAGMACAQAQQYDKAIDELTKAIERAELYNEDTTGRQAARMLSNVYMAMGIESFNKEEYSKALEVFTKGYASDPQNVKLMAYVAKSHSKLGDLESSGKIYGEIIAKAVENDKFKEDAAEAKSDYTNDILVALSAAAQAKELPRVIELNDMLEIVVPNEPISSITIVQLANNLKQYDSVIKYGEKAAADQIDAAKKSEVNFLLGIAYQNRDNKAKAIEAFRKVTTGPNVAAARTAIAELSK